MDLTEFRQIIEKYANEIEKDLEEVKKQSNLAKQVDRANCYSLKHKENLEELEKNKPEGWWFDDDYDTLWKKNGKSLGEYKKKVKEFKEFWSELLKKFGEERDEKWNEERKRENELKTSYCAYCRKKPPTEHYIYSKKNKNLKLRKREASLLDEWLFCSNEHFEKWYKRNYFCCVECNEECYDGKYDNQKFCSQKCFNNHYAETCDKCHQKALWDTYYLNSQTKTGTLCSKCNRAEIADVEREVKEKWDELKQSSKSLGKQINESEKEENLINHCQKCSVSLLPNQPDICDNCLDKDTNLDKSNQIKSNLQQFSSNSISSVELTDDGDLKINYFNKSPATLKVSELSNNSFYSKIKENMEKEGIKKLAKEDLEKKLREIEKNNQREQEPSKNRNLGLKIGLGCLVVVGLLGLVMIVKRKKKH